MRAAYDVEQITAAEKPLLAALPDGTLMQRAATALARRCASLLVTTYGARVVVLAGSGNNGADALFAGAQLARRGARVDALLTGDRWHGPARTAFEAAGGRVHPAGDGAKEGSAAARLLAAADLVIDGILGIGGRGGLRDAGAGYAQ